MTRRALYAYVVATIGLYSLALSSGCAHSAPPRIEPPKSVATPREMLNAFECPEKRADTDEEKAAEREVRFAALKLDMAVDHVRFVRYGTEMDQELFAAHGAACGMARERLACEAKLAEHEARGRAKQQVFAITVKGDDVTLYEGREVVSLLGPIDNADKAWVVLMVHANVASYSCNEPEWHGYLETADGYDLTWVWTDSICRPFQRKQAIDHVDRTGNVTRLRLHVVEHDAEACIIDESGLKRYVDDDPDAEERPPHMNLR